MGLHGLGTRVRIWSAAPQATPPVGPPSLHPGSSYSCFPPFQNGQTALCIGPAILALVRTCLMAHLRQCWADADKMLRTNGALGLCCPYYSLHLNSVQLKIEFFLFSKPAYMSLVTRSSHLEFYIVKFLTGKAGYKYALYSNVVIKMQ